MKQHQIFFFLAISLFILNCRTNLVAAQEIDGPVARKQLTRTVQKLLYQEKFDELDKMAHELRKTKAKFPEGAWKLMVYYGGFYPLEKTPDGWKRFLAKLDKWLQKYPNSVTARVAAANAWISYGWEARGDGTADTVTEEGWRLLKERLKKADDLLPKDPVRPEDDCPERYDVLLTLAKARGWDQPHFEALFHEAVTFEPTYHSYYVLKADYLRPQWHGEEGEWQQFAQDATKLTPVNEGKSVYTRILWSFWWDNVLRSFNEPGISWTLMKQGFMDIERNYPGSPWNLNNFCKFACLAGDKETARELFKRIADHPYLEAWNDADEYNKWQEWAGVEVKRNDKGEKLSYRTSSEEFRQTLHFAENGDLEAQYAIGQYYESASNFVQYDFGKKYDATSDLAKASYWYRKAADGGHSGAQHSLGLFYVSGKMPDVGRFSAGATKEAMKWFFLAAMQGNFNAATSLADFYSNGGPRFTNFVKAYAWCSQHGIKQDAQLDEIAAKLTPTELKQAELEAIKLREEIRANKVAAEIEPLNPRNIKIPPEITAVKPDGIKIPLEIIAVKPNGNLNKTATQIKPLYPLNTKIPPEFIAVKPDGNLLVGAKWLSSGDALTDGTTVTIKNGGQLAAELRNTQISNGCVLVGGKIRHSRPKATVAGAPFFGMLMASSGGVRPIEEGQLLVPPESKKKTGAWWQVYPITRRVDGIVIMLGTKGSTDEEKNGSSTEFHDMRLMAFPTCDEAKAEGEKLYKQ